MGFFDGKKAVQTPPGDAACDREIATLEQREREIYLNIGQRYAAEFTAAKAAGTAYGPDLAELEKITKRKEILEKRKLAAQGMRKCDKCGQILSLDSVFCNKCGEKLEAVAPEVFTDGPLCPQCKAPVEQGATFCTKCGTSLVETSAETTGSVLKCPGCGADCEPGTKFCIKCGKALEGQAI